MSNVSGSKGKGHGQSQPSRITTSARDRTATIVGSGLVGSLLANFLARRGFAVEVFERRSPERPDTAAAGRSINLALSTRGLRALGEVGLAERVVEQAIPMRGRLIHHRDGSTELRPYSKNPNECLYSISRGGLNKLLMRASEEAGRVTIYSQHTVEAMEPDTGALQVFDARSGQRDQVGTQVVFGTDGAGSAVRQALSQHLGAHMGKKEPLAHGYKELTIHGDAGGRHRMDANALHIWPRGQYMLIALPNLDGSFTCTLFLPFEGDVSFASITTPEQVTELFSQQFPDAAALIDDLCGDYFENPTGQLATLRTNQWHLGGQALLIGDAAHAIVPFFGQGMNAGFEDCTELMALFDSLVPAREHPDWATIFERFAKQRMPNANAIADMAIDNFVEMRDRVADPHFLLKKAIESRLEDHFGTGCQSRYQLVTFSNVPYRLAQQVGIAQETILDALAKSVSLTQPTRPAARSSDFDQVAQAVDMKEAKALIDKHLTPLMEQVAAAASGASPAAA